MKTLLLLFFEKSDNRLNDLEIAIKADKNRFVY